MNLAVVLRLRGHNEAAREMDERALAGFRGCYAYDHPSTLVASTNLASDLAAVGETYQARELGRRTLAASQSSAVTTTRPRWRWPPTSRSTCATPTRRAALALRDETLAAYDDRLIARASAGAAGVATRPGERGHRAYGAVVSRANSAATYSRMTVIRRKRSRQ